MSAEREQRIDVIQRTCESNEVGGRPQPQCRLRRCWELGYGRPCNYQNLGRGSVGSNGHKEDEFVKA